MTFEDIKLLLVEKFGPDVIAGEETGGLQPALLINPDLIADVCRELRNNSKTYFDFLASITGVDYGVEQKPVSALFITWHQYPIKHKLTLKISKENDRSFG